MTTDTKKRNITMHKIFASSQRSGDAREQFDAYHRRTYAWQSLMGLTDEKDNVKLKRKRIDTSILYKSKNQSAANMLKRAKQIRNELTNRFIPRNIPSALVQLIFDFVGRDVYTLFVSNQIIKMSQKIESTCLIHAIYPGHKSIPCIASALTDGSVYIFLLNPIRKIYSFNMDNMDNTDLNIFLSSTVTTTNESCLWVATTFECRLYIVSIYTTSNDNNNNDDNEMNMNLECVLCVKVTRHAFSCIQALNSSEIIIGLGSGLIQVHKRKENRLEEVIALRGHKDAVCSLSLESNDTNNKNILISGSVDGTIKIWNYRTGVCIKILNLPNNIIQAVCCLSNGFVFIGSVRTHNNKNNMTVWDTNSIYGAKTPESFGSVERPHVVNYIPNSKLLVFGTDENGLQFYNIITKEIEHEITDCGQCHNTNLSVILPLSNGQIYIGGEDGTLSMLE